jgi:DNA-binding LytR/AlgR family response regulator
MNLLIVDESQARRVALIDLCGRGEALRVVGEAASGAEALGAARTLHPDLMLLDVELPDMTGFEVLRMLRQRREGHIIMMTDDVCDRTAALAAGAIECLVRPILHEAFWPSVVLVHERLRTSLSASRGVSQQGPPEAAHADPLFLVGERERCLYPLEPRNIDYVKSDGNYVKYRAGRVEYIARDSIKRLEILLKPYAFLRIERTLLVNVRAIAYAQPAGHGVFAFTLLSGDSLRSGYGFRENILSLLPLRRCATPAAGQSSSLPQHDATQTTRLRRGKDR